jgi:hypothetical protein
MSQTRIRLTRAELYEKVWATPMRTFLSDHPKPANGYHLKTGQRE